MLSAGPIPHNSIHLLIITADFVALYRFYWICPFIITSYLAGVESTDQCLLNLSFILFFWSHNEYKIVFSIYLQSFSANHDTWFEHTAKLLCNT